MRGVMPWIDKPDAFNKVYVVPNPYRPQCVQCHQADPFITNEFINAAKIPGNEGKCRSDSRSEVALLRHRRSELGHANLAHRR